MICPYQDLGDPEEEWCKNPEECSIYKERMEEKTKKKQTKECDIASLRAQLQKKKADLAQARQQIEKLEAAFLMTLEQFMTAREAREALEAIRKEASCQK